MIPTILLAATLLCEGNIQTNTGSKQHVTITLKKMTNERLEIGLQNGSITLQLDKRFTFSAPLDEFGSIVEIKLAKHSGNAHYTYLNFGSDGDMKSAASGWLSCRKL